VADRVRCLGRVSDENLPKVYAACDVFVLPSVSRLEAFGIVALEAMATAKPVIVADIPGVREVIEDGREGLLADPLNARDLAEKIRRLLADPEARRVMGERGREKVLESFGIERVTDQIEGVYRSVLGPQDCAELAGIHVAGRLQDHPQGLAGDRGDALHWRSSLPGQLFLDASVEIVPEPDELGAALRGGQDDVFRPLQGRLVLPVH